MRFSLQDVSYVGRVEEFFNMVNKRVIVKYCEIFLKFDKEFVGKLRDVVICQVIFVDKMNVYFWIWSFVVEGMFWRVIDWYIKFFGIFVCGKKFIIVLILDVDFVWYIN